jgi:hypothetical protein
MFVPEINNQKNKTMKGLNLLQCFEVTDAIQKGIANFNKEAGYKCTTPNIMFLNETKMTASKKATVLSFLLTKIIALKWI